MNKKTFFGYMGKILRVDLSERKTWIDELDESTCRKYMGGVSLGSKYLYEEVSPDMEWSSPENRLIFMTGPLTGSKSPKSSRYIVAGISPLTGIWGQAHGGGAFGRGALQTRHERRRRHARGLVAELSGGGRGA